MAPRSSTPAAAPLTRDKWADAALDHIARSGPETLAVEPLARELGVTKGSFYHHFSSREELLEAALARWEERGTTGVQDRLTGAQPAERLEQLFLAAMDTAVDPRWGQLLTHLAAHSPDPMIGPVLERVTAKRLETLEQMWTAAGFEQQEAHARALLAYTAYLGMVQLAVSAPDRVPTDEALRTYVGALVQMLVRDR